MRIAALDLGSNSFHLLVADVHADGTFLPLVREKEMLRLGDGVARDGRVPDAMAEAAIATVRRFRKLADAAGARETLARATAPYRTPAPFPQAPRRGRGERAAGLCDDRDPYRRQR